ncbi:MAG: Fe-S-containing protein [Acidobacteriota bacterium]
MRRFKPAYGVALLALFMTAVLAAEMVLTGSGGRDFQRVAPDREGRVVLEVTDLEPNDVQFYRFLNAGNQEVKFFVGRDEDGVIQVAFDAAENDYRRKRGFRSEDGWVVNNKCDTAGRLSEVNAGGGGCRPVPLQHRLESGRLVLEERDILSGWRYFR